MVEHTYGKEHAQQVAGADDARRHGACRDRGASTAPLSHTVSQGRDEVPWYWAGSLEEVVE